MRTLKHERWIYGLGMTVAMMIAFPVTGGAQNPPAFADLPVVRPVMECRDLIRARLSAKAGVAMNVESAAVVESAPAPYCQVKGYVSPQVFFEVHLPTTNWTQRFLLSGCGGLCGSISVRTPDTIGNVVAERGELAVAGSDAGHIGAGGTWGADDPQLRIDFAYRGVHVTTLAAKALIETYYGQKPKYSYFVGSSEGGRQTAMESQRFPEDFQGISSGSPAINWLTQNTFYHAWNSVKNTDDNNRPVITSAQLPLLNAAAIAACDAQDGLKDGLISEPRTCRFDPAVIQCKPGQDAATCLTAAQVQVAREVYRGAHDDKGRQVIIQGPMPGSELSWQQFVPQNNDMAFAGGANLANGVILNMAFPKNPPLGYTLKDFHFDQATFDAIAPMHAIYDALDPDLSKFAAAGGKIIFMHGWADAAISPVSTINYYHAAETMMGKDKLRQFSRLYLIPGRYHGASSDTGPIRFDTFTPLMSWVEKGVAPQELISSYIQASPSSGRGGAAAAPTGKVLRTRPVFPYPQVAQYKGSGSIDEAANFKAAMPPAGLPEQYDWMGNSFFSTNYEQWCGWNGMSFTCGKARK